MREDCKHRWGMLGFYGVAGWWRDGSSPTHFSRRSVRPASPLKGKEASRFGSPRGAGYHFTRSVDVCVAGAASLVVDSRVGVSLSPVASYSGALEV